MNNPTAYNFSQTAKAHANKAIAAAKAFRLKLAGIATEKAPIKPP